jgi:aminoglycoside phosphotransferase
MYKATVIIPKNALQVPAVRRAVRVGMDKSADLAERELAAPTRRWKHTVSFTTSSPDEYTRVVGTNSDIYLFNDQPTRAHKIAARRAKRLAFMSRGRMRFPKVVNHPGTKGKYLARRAAEVVQGRMPAIFNAEISAAIS